MHIVLQYKYKCILAVWDKLIFSPTIVDNFDACPSVHFITLGLGTTFFQKREEVGRVAGHLAENYVKC